VDTTTDPTPGEAKGTSEVNVPPNNKDPFSIRLEIDKFFPRSNKCSGTLTINNNSDEPVTVELLPIREPVGVLLQADDELSKLRTLQNIKFRSAEKAIDRFYRIEHAFRSVVYDSTQIDGFSVLQNLRARWVYWTSRNYAKGHKFYSVDQLKRYKPEVAIYRAQGATLELVKRVFFEATQLDEVIAQYNSEVIPPKENYDRIFVMVRWPRSFGQSSGLVKLIPGYLMPPVWSSPGPR
jgi:hypothetical protein